MSDFSIGDAVGSGFSLIAKRPVAVVAWGIAYILIIALPLLLVGAAMIPDFLELVRAGVQNPHPSEPPPAFFVFFSKFMLLFPVLMLASIAGRAMLQGAIYRGMLEPDNRSFLSLRLGRQELWLAILSFAFGWVVGFAIIAIAIAGALVAALGWAAGGLLPHPSADVVRGVVVVVAVIGSIVAWFLVLLRLSLAFPMTFAAKEFRLFESWSLTKGHALKLFGLGLVVFFISLAIALVVNIVARIGMFSMIGGLDPEHMQSFAERVRASPQILIAALAPAFVALAVIELFLLGPLSAIVHAPWAYAYRELSKGAKPQHPPVF